MPTRGRMLLASVAVVGVLVAAGLVTYLGSHVSPESTTSTTQTSSATTSSNRYEAIPSWAPKYTPLNDTHPPVIHSNQWQQPVPLPGPINTAGAEDSPFITPDGSWFFFFFTPDLRVPASQQVGDAVTGIWWSTRVGDSWSDPTRVMLGSSQSLDGCEFVQGNTMWFCSARAGNYRGVDLYTAKYVGGAWTDVANAGRLINQVYQVGEMAISPDNQTMYYGSNGKIWALNNVNGNWTDPHVVPGLDVTTGENLPFVTPDGEELWFTGDSTLGYPGPAIFLSSWNGSAWGAPTEVVSQFAGEPALDSAGNLYFVHHFLDSNGSLAEADIYVAYRTSQPTAIVPADSQRLPERGYYMGILPSPGPGQSLDAAYSQASEDAELVPVWGRPTPFYDLASDLSGSWGSLFVTTLVRDKGMIPLVHMSFIGTNMTLVTPPGMENATLSDPAWRASYEQAALDIVKASRPLFLSLGNEVNMWYEKYGARDGDPNGFQNFVSLYNQMYDAVKKLSPQTYVFCTFARENVPQNREADLSVLSLFNSSKLDLLVFTSYPSALQGIRSPSDLPDDYYSRALSYMPGKPMGFSELGWSANEYFGGEAGQAQFLAQVAGRLTRAQGVDLRILCWAWLHDLSSTDQVGLISYNGTARQAYQTWESLAHPTG